MAPKRTSWNDPLVDNSEITKIEGNALNFAYDSHMQNLENFAAQTEDEEGEEPQDQLLETAGKLQWT